MMQSKNLNSLLQDRRFILAGVFFFTVIGLFLRFARRMEAPLIGDELYTIGVITRYDTFVEFFRKLPHLEFSSYLSGDYYLLYPFAQIFGENKWGVTIPHIISTLFCFYFLYKACQIHLKTAVGFFIAFAIVCFNASLIERSLELRYYAVLQTLGIASYYFIYLLAYRPHPLSKMKLFGIGVFLSLTLLFHFYCVIMIFANLAYILAIELADRTQLMDRFKKLAPVFSIVFLITIPIIYIVLFVLFHLNEGIWEGNVFRYIPNPLYNLTGFLKGIFGNLIGYKLFTPLVIGLPISILLLHKDSKKQFWFLLLLVICPITLLLVLDLKSGYWFVQKQFIWIMPLFAVLTAWAWESILTKLHPKYCP